MMGTVTKSALHSIMEEQNLALGERCRNKNYFLVQWTQSPEGQMGLKQGPGYARAAAYTKADVGGEPHNSEIIG